MLLGHDLDILVWARLLQRQGQWQPRRDLEPTVTCRFRPLRLLGYETGLSLGTFRDLRVLGDDTWCSTEIMPETTEHANPIFRWRPMLLNPDRTGRFTRLNREPVWLPVRVEAFLRI